MLGQSIGLTPEQLSHLADDPLPEGLYSPREAAVIRYAQVSTRWVTIDDALYVELSEHFTGPQILELCLVVGMSNFTNRMHATFLTPIDQGTLEALAGQGGERPPDELPISLDLP